MSGLARILASGRFPRAAAVVEIMAIAELCKATAARLERLAEHAHNYEPGSLRREAHGLVRELHGELEGQVTL